MLNELHERLEVIRQENNSPSQFNVSRNLQQNQNVVQQISTDQQTLFVQELDLFEKQAKIQRNPKKVPSVADLTFFDLSNPTHLNKLYSRLEEIQALEEVESTP